MKPPHPSYGVPPSCCVFFIFSFSPGLSFFMRSSEARAGLLGLLANLTLVFSFVPVLTGPGVTNQRSGRRCGPACTKVYSSSSSSSSSRSAGQAATEKPADGASQESEVFDWLAANAGIRTKAVSLGVTRGGYRGLVATEDVEEGQVGGNMFSGKVSCCCCMGRNYLRNAVAAGRLRCVLLSSAGIVVCSGKRAWS